MGSTYVQPNFTTQGASAYKANIDAGFDTVEEIGAQFNPEEMPTATMQVRLLTGRVFDGSNPTTVATQNSSTFTAPTSLSRIDRVVIDRDTGSLGVVTGTTATNPSAPNITLGTEPVAQISLTSGVSAITNDRITDERNLRHVGHVEIDNYIQPGAFDIRPGTTATATTVDVITGGKVAVNDFNGNHKIIDLAAANDAFDIATTGSGGLINSSTQKAITWYEGGIIADSTGSNSPAVAFWEHSSGNDNTPTASGDLPSGYDLFRAMGSPGRTWWVRTDGSSNILQFLHFSMGWYVWKISAINGFSTLINETTGLNDTEFTADISNQAPPVPIDIRGLALGGKWDGTGSGAGFIEYGPESGSSGDFYQHRYRVDSGASDDTQRVPYQVTGISGQQFFVRSVGANFESVLVNQISAFKTIG